jgi:mRNA interferase RelE/StbE
MFKIIYSKTFLKQIKKLPLNIQKRIFNSLERCRIRPQAYVKKLVGIDYFRLRVGDYRIILDIKSGELIIYVLQVGHRKKIYQ